MWISAMPSSATAIEQMNGTMAPRTGKSRPSAVMPGTDQGRRSCAARIAASSTRTSTRPVVIPAYCTPSSFTTFVSVGDGSAVAVDVGAGEGSEVGSVVEDGSGEGVAGAVSVAVGSGDGEGKVTPGFTTVTKFPLEVADDVSGKSSNKTEGKEWGDDERIHYRPQMIESSSPSAILRVPTMNNATDGTGEASL